MNMAQVTADFQPRLTRRNILRGAPAAALALTASTATAFQGPVPAEPDPLPEWFRQWREKRAAWAAHPDGEGDEADALWDESEALGSKILSARPTTPQGAAAQIDYALEDVIAGAYYPDGQDRQMLRGISDLLKGRAV